MHRRSGLHFVGAMVVMGLSGAGIAAWTGVPSSVTAGLMAAYVVVTALTTVRPPAAGSRWLDLGGMVVAFGVGLATLAMGLETVAAGAFARDGVAAPMIFLFGAVYLSAFLGDLLVDAGEPLVRLGGGGAGNPTGPFHPSLLEDLMS